MTHLESIEAFSPIDLPAPLFESYRVASYRGGKIFTGTLHPYYAARPEELRQVLKSLPGKADCEVVGGQRRLTLNLYTPADRPNYLLHIGLFLATLLTTTASGAVQKSEGPLPAFGVLEAVSNCFTQLVGALGRSVIVLLTLGGRVHATRGATADDVVGPLVSHLRFLSGGLLFSLALLTILGAHELCHYFAARRRGIRASLPYFIPLPFLIGTLGALIRVRSPFVHRRALLEVGVAGPLASFALSTVAIVLGLAYRARLDWLSYDLLNRMGETFIVNDSLLTHVATHLRFASMSDVAGKGMELEPLFWAGWIGLFVTMLNLLPLGQLDGGHILYALSRKLHQGAQTPLIVLMFMVGAAGFIMWGADELIRAYGGIFRLFKPIATATPPVWPGWMLWALIARFIIRPSHPPLIDDSVPLGGWRTVIAVIGLTILILAFLPNPFSIIPPVLDLPGGGQLV